MRADIRREVRALADWLGLELRDESRQG
jgi:hypothetical protein